MFSYNVSLTSLSELPRQSAVIVTQDVAAIYLIVLEKQVNLFVTFQHAKLILSYHSEQFSLSESVKQTVLSAIELQNNKLTQSTEYVLVYLFDFWVLAVRLSVCFAGPSPAVNYRFSISIANCIDFFRNFSLSTQTLHNCSAE